MGEIAVIEVVQGNDVVEIEVQQPTTVIDVVDLGTDVAAIDVDVVDEDPFVSVEDDTPTIYIEVVPDTHVIDVELIRDPIVAIDIEVSVMPGPEGEQGPPGGNATGTITVASTVWVIDHNADMKPAGLRFFDEDDNELEPESITYVDDQQLLAFWPEAIAGSWIIS